MLAAVFGGCGGAAPVGGPTSTPVETSTTTLLPTTTATPPPDTVSGGELDVIVPPDAEGNYPMGLMVSCGSGRFPIGALQDIRPLEAADPGGVAAAIEPFLTSGEGEFWPQEGWQILDRSEAHVLLVAKADDGSLAFMSASNEGSGWTWSGASGGGESCPLEFVVPDHLNTVDWRLDPTGQALTSESTEVSVILNERPCVSGSEIGDRLLDPQIVMTEAQVFMAFAAEPPPGDAFDCPGNPDTPHVVELPEPLGDRELMEGLEIGVDLADYVD